MKLASIARNLQRSETRRNLLLAGALAAVLAVYLLAENSLSATREPPALPTRTVSSVADLSSSDDGYFLREYDVESSAAVSEPWWALAVDVGIKLAIVLGLIYGAARVLRRYGGAGRFGLPPSGRAITLLETTNLAPNRSLYLVGVGGKVLLLGATTNQLSTLAEIADPAQVAALKGGRPAVPQPADDGQVPPSGLPSFQAQLEEALVAERPAGPDLQLLPDPLVEGRDFLQRKIADVQRIATGFRRSP